MKVTSQQQEINPSKPTQRSIPSNFRTPNQNLDRFELDVDLRNGRRRRRGLHDQGVSIKYLQSNGLSLDLRRGPYNIYSPHKKEEALDLLHRGYNFSEVSKMLSVPIKNLRRWAVMGTQRRIGGGRKLMDAQMEANLYQWILNEMKVKQRKVSRSEIRKKALELSQYQDRFKASKGWTDKFVRKNGLKRASMKKLIESLKSNLKVVYGRGEYQARGIGR